MLTQEVSEVDRLLIISELEQVIQSLVTDQTINVEFDVEDNGNEKVITITTTSTLTGITEEEAVPEEEEDSNDNGDDNDATSMSLEDRFSDIQCSGLIDLCLLSYCSSVYPPCPPQFTAGPSCLICFFLGAFSFNQKVNV
jgi:hypothetical protein